MNIFDYLYEDFRFEKDKPIRLFESFAGIGFQRMGLELAEIPYEVVGISEIDKFALQAYQAIHGECPNLGSITDIKGREMPKDIDLFTYSFPCTDLSKAGKQKGLDNTRSGLVYEVLRLLQELKESDNLPKVLIMENVVDLVQTKFIKEFNEIQSELEEIGYTNYTQTLNAKNYGIAQNRDRVFMVSILGEYNYNFPKGFELKHRLKDYLEGYAEAKEGDGVYINRPHQKRGVVQKDMIQTLKTSGNDVGVVVNAQGVYLNESERFRTKPFKEMSRCLKANNHDAGVIENELRIRKLTTRETGRLMGMNDEQICKQLEVVSNAQAYKQHGNGIVAQVIGLIIGMMVYEDENELKETVMKSSHTWLERNK